MRFLIRVTYPSGQVVTLSFPSAFLRGLHLLLLASQPVILQPYEDP